MPLNAEFNMITEPTINVEARILKMLLFLLYSSLFDPVFHPAAHILGRSILRWLGSQELHHARRCVFISHVGVLSGK